MTHSDAQNLLDALDQIDRSLVIVAITTGWVCVLLSVLAWRLRK